MAESDDTKNEDLPWLYGAAVVAGLLVVIPAAVGAVVWWALRRRLASRDWVIVAVAAIVAMVVAPDHTLGAYFRWLEGLIPPGVDLWPLPWLGLIVPGFLLGAVWGLVAGTPVGQKLTARIRSDGPDDVVVPSEAQRERARRKVSTADDKFFAIDADAHTPDGSQPGSRSFILGLDAHSQSPVRLSETEIRTHAVLLGATGSGKALAVDTPIPTPTGWTTMGELQVGDLVFDERGEPVPVTFATEVMEGRPCWEVVFSDGERIVADSEHRWWVSPINSRGEEYIERVATTDELRERLSDGWGWAVPVAGPLRFSPDQPPPGDPYEIGSSVVRGDEDPTGLPPQLPAWVSCGSVEDRLSFLQGMMDAAGSVSRWRGCELSVPATIAAEVRELVCGLGMVAVVHQQHGPAATVRFWATRSVFRREDLVRKLPVHAPASACQRYVAAVRPHRSVPVRCIQVGSPRHLYLCGRTGVVTHNTETIKNLVANLGDLGWSTIVLDLKEDTAPGGLRDFCSVYARSHALRYQEIALSNPANRFWFNPLAGMTLDEAINTILSLQTFDDGYWQAVNRTMIGQVCTLFFDAYEVDPIRFGPPDMYSIGNLLRQQNLPQVTKEMRAIVLASRPDRRPEDFSALATPSDAEKQSASGLGSRIVNMFESEAGRRVLRPGDGREPLDVCAGGLVYVGLNTLGLSELARVVSTSALLRLATYAGARTTGSATGSLTPTAVIIDEANWIDRRQVQNLLSRARSAGIAVVLCTQGPEDWNDENGSDWNTITQNTNVAVIMRQGNEHNAELCADLIGKRVKTSLISQVRDGSITESGTLAERVDYIVSPSEIRGLRVGEAILKVGVPVDRVEYCAIRQRRPDDHSRRSH